MVQVLLACTERGVCQNEIKLAVARISLPSGGTSYLSVCTYLILRTFLALLLAIGAPHCMSHTSTCFASYCLMLVVIYLPHCQGLSYIWILRYRSSTLLHRQFIALCVLLRFLHEESMIYF